METSTVTSQVETFSIQIPKVDVKRFKGLMKVMGWTFSKNAVQKVAPILCLRNGRKRRSVKPFSILLVSMRPRCVPNTFDVI